MTWAQTLTIVVPILVAIVAGIFYSNKQFELLGRVISDLHADMNARFTSVDTRFTSVDSRFTIVENRLTAIDDRLEKRLTGFKTEMENRLTSVDARFDRFEAKLDARFDRIETRVGELQQDFRELRGLLHDVLKSKAS